MEKDKNYQYFEDLFKFKDEIEIIGDVYNKLQELSKSFSMNEDQSGNKIGVSEYEVYKRLSTLYFYRDGYNVTKELLKDNNLKSAKDIQTPFKDTSHPHYNRTLMNYLKTQVNPNVKEYSDLFSSDPVGMTKVEQLLGSYSTMKNTPEIVATVVNLDINDEYIDVLLQLNQQISGFDYENLIDINGDVYDTSEDNVLCIQKINFENNTIDLASIDSNYEEIASIDKKTGQEIKSGEFVGNIYKDIPIQNVLEVLLDLNLTDKDVEGNITHININDLKFSNPNPILVLENVIEELKNEAQELGI